MTVGNDWASADDMLQHLSAGKERFLRAGVQPEPWLPWRKVNAPAPRSLLAAIRVFRQNPFSMEGWESFFSSVSPAMSLRRKSPAVCSTPGRIGKRRSSWSSATRGAGRSRRPCRRNTRALSILPALPEFDSQLSPWQRLAQAVESNVRWAVRQIRSTPEGQARVAEGRMKVVGVVYEIETGARFLWNE